MTDLKQKIDFHYTMKDMEYSLAKSEELAEVADFFYSVFLNTEPMVVSMGGYDHFPSKLREDIMSFISDGLTIIARNKDKELVGIQIAYKKERKDVMNPNNVDEMTSLSDYLRNNPYIRAHISHYFDQIMTLKEVFELDPNIDSIYCIHALATAENIRGQGVAKKMAELGLKVAKMAKCDAIFLIATNDISRAVYRRFGFQILREKSLIDYCVEDRRPFQRCSSNLVTFQLLRLQKESSLN